MSGLSISIIEKCDGRNPNIIESLGEMDVVVLAGGHVPTQNLFLKQLRLKERLSDYKGIVVAWSAGSMNCATKVYASPELEGEAIDPLYKRWIDGIGITNVNIFPHFQSLKDAYLDGLRVIEDITFADSMKHEIIALNDGSYMLIDDEHETLYGESYLIKNGKIKQLCKDNESFVLK
jgi:dipeptidase E